jgi:hypothetical protein
MLNDRASMPGKGKEFVTYPVSTLALRPTQPPIQWVVKSFPGGKARPGRDADDSPQASA